MWPARLIALVLFIGVALAGAICVDRFGQSVQGDDVQAAMTPLEGMKSGAPVLIGNSVAKSAIEVTDLRRELSQPNMVDLTLHGSGPTTWFVLYTHLLNQREHPPRLAVIVTSMGWLTRSIPVADRDFALELARHDDPRLAELLGISGSTLGWERRFAARLRVRDALVHLIAEPLAMRVAGPDASMEGLGPINRAVQLTLGRNAGGNLMRGASLGGVAVAGHVEVLSEVESAFVQLMAAMAEQNVRVVLVLLPQREASGGLTVDQVGEVLPRNVQVVDFTAVPFQPVDYQDNQHFAPGVHDALSASIAANVSVAMLQRSVRYFPVTERPAY